MRKLVIGLMGLVCLGMLTIAARLAVLEAVADAEVGLSPFTAIPLEDGRNTGLLAPGESRWYELSPEAQGAFQRQADLTLFFTPEDGNRAHRVNFQIFPADQIARWYAGEVSAMANLGAGGVISRDGNPVTGELLWSGWIDSGGAYYIQILNGTDVTIDYWLFTDDVIAAELGPAPDLTSSEAASAEIIPVQSAAPAPVAPVSTAAGADVGSLLPLASELQSDQLVDSSGTGITPSGVPTRLMIPKIELDSKIVPVGKSPVEINGVVYGQWNTVDNVVGWHDQSAVLGEVGNTVFNGHSDVSAAVFRDLEYLEIGDEITVFSGSQEYHFWVARKFLVAEGGVSLQERLLNAELVAETQDERLTLITCANRGASHRLIVVALPGLDTFRADIKTGAMEF